MFAIALSLLLGTCDLGEIFAEKSAWEESAVDFTVDHQRDGFNFASQKRDIVNCLRRGACTWKGIEVWEARIYYGDEGASKVEVFLYNRGDDRSIDGLDNAGLKELLDRAAAAAEEKGKIGSNPEKKKLKNGGFQYFKRFTKGDYNVEITWGVNGAKTKDLTADYVKVTFYQKGESRPKGLNRQVATSVSKLKVKANVRKSPEGDVWIDNVPMVDQGQKGYCAAATSERLLRYYGFSVDEHEIAQMAGTSAQGGTSVSDMIETVKTVGSKCRLGFQSIVSMSGTLKDLEKDLEQYNRVAKAEKDRELSMAQFTRGNVIMVGELKEAMKPKIVKKARMKDSRYKKFLSGIHQQIDLGIPVVWGVSLGLFPEPEIPQARGGHMRLIIGYNEKKKEIIYSDSWGAGHELKRMPEDWAFAITHDAFFLRPL